MTTAASQKSQNQKPPTQTQEPDEKVLLMDVREIAIDHSWNARSGSWWEDQEITPPTKPNGDAEAAESKPKKPRKEKVSEKGGFGDFRASILESGTNIEPVLCRQPAKPGGKPRLVCGFRRTRAILELAEQAGYEGPALAQKGLVRVIVREMTEQQARLANGIENIARDDLSGPDLCWFVGELTSENKHNLTDKAAADKLGKSQPYISKLHRIYSALSPKVLEMWRKSPVRVTIDDIEKEVIMVSKDSDSRPSAAEQEEYFKRVVEGKGGKQSTSRGPDAWIETKQKEADDLGQLLGLLQALDLIDVKEKDPQVLLFSVIELPKRHKELNPAKRAKVERAILAAFSAGVESGMAEAVDDEDEDEDDEDDEESED